MTPEPSRRATFPPMRALAPLGTVVATPGPPVVVAYRQPDPVRYRANLALLFLVVAVVAVIGRATAGQLGATDWRLGLMGLGPALLGLAIGRLLARRVPAGWVRRAGLLLACGSGVLLLVSAAV